MRLQEWARETGARIVIVFEGRDAAGKGGTIKRITEYLSPRIARIAALPAPTERDAGSGTTSAISRTCRRGVRSSCSTGPGTTGGVEKAMGFWTAARAWLFLRQTPIFEQMLIDDGIIVRKYWFSVSDEEQLRRFRSRRSDPVRQWKLSPMDLESIFRWEDYSRAKDEMMVHTDIPMSPWYVVESDSKKHARLNTMADLLSTIDYEDVEAPVVDLPAHPVRSGNYHRPPRELSTYVDDYVAAVLGEGSEASRPPDDAGRVAATRRQRFDVPGQRHRVRGDTGRVLCRAAQRAKHLLIEGMQRSAATKGASGSPPLAFHRPRLSARSHCHDLVDETVEGVDAGGGFAAAEHVRPSTTPHVSRRERKAAVSGGPRCNGPCR